MIQTETFVGTLAVILAVGLVGIAIKPSLGASQLRLARALEQRYGHTVARAALAGIALLLVLAGIMILRDIRPGFAAPQTENDTGEETGSGVKNRNGPTGASHF